MIKIRLVSDIGVGRKFNSWTIIGPHKGLYIPCRCRCGLEKLVKTTYLRRGRSTKCFACARKEANGIRNRAAALPVEVRFWNMVDKNGPQAYEGLGKCWKWLGKPGKAGYGIICIGTQKYTSAHRCSWLLHHGDMHKLHVLHKCDNRLCINPDHLFLGTHQDNMADAVAKGRQARGERSGRYTHPERTARGIRHGRYNNPNRTGIGEDNGNAKLNESKVLRILITYRRGSKTCGGPALAKCNQVTQGIISGIIRGKLWKSVYERWVIMGSPKRVLLRSHHP